MDGINNSGVNLLVEMTSGERAALEVWLREALKVYLNTDKADEAVDMFALFRMRLRSARENTAQEIQSAAPAVPSKPKRVVRKR